LNSFIDSHVAVFRFFTRSYLWFIWTRH